MTTHSAPTATTVTDTASYDRFAGLCALASVIGALIYSVTFVITKTVALYSLALLVGGIFTTIVLVAVYQRVRATDAGFALLGLSFALAGAFGSIVHGAYDLSNALHPETSPARVLTGASADALSNLPSGVDPRGVLTFGAAGLGLFVLSWLIVHGGALPKGLGYLGLLLAVLLVYLYAGRLIIFDANNFALKGPAGLTGLLISPLWSLWAGITLLRGKRL